MAIKAAEPPARTPNDVAQFGAAHEKEPTTATELFDLVCGRPMAIQHDIEKDEFGDRGIFPNNVAVEIVQRYFAGRLERASRQRYAVTREEEVADHEELDIRVRHARAGVVSIEIKPLDSRRYSIEALRKALSNQLDGQYMRAAKSNYGTLLLCMGHERRWRVKGSNRNCEFTELIDSLRADCARLVADRSNIHGLEVIGISATPLQKVQGRTGQRVRPHHDRPP